MIGDGVRSGVAWSQQPSERLTGLIGEAEHRVEPEAALVRGLGLLLVLRVDLDARRVDVEQNSIRSIRRRRPPPHLGSHLRHRLSDAIARPRIDLVERPGNGGVGGDGAEQGTTDAQVLDVEAALPTTGEHERHLGEDLAPVVDRDPVAAPGDGRREGNAEPQPVGERTERVQPDVGHHPGPTGFHDDATSAGTVHVGSALLVGDCGFEHQQFPLLEGPFRGRALVGSNGGVKRPG